jgi:hypothetical protein
MRLTTLTGTVIARSGATKQSTGAEWIASLRSQ